MWNAADAGISMREVLCAAVATYSLVAQEISIKEKNRRYLDLGSNRIAAFVTIFIVSPIIVTAVDIIISLFGFNLNNYENIINIIWFNIVIMYIVLIVVAWLIMGFPNRSVYITLIFRLLFSISIVLLIFETIISYVM